jgi:electron transport complex protein RnfG
MNQLFKFGIVLGVICLTATFVLALTYQITRPRIEEQLRLEEQEALKEIAPLADSFVEKSIDGIEYLEAIKENKLIGYCLRITTSGYNGYIRLLAGIDLNGVITGVRVLEHQETPGLGAKISEIKPGEKDPWFLKQFIGKSARTIQVKKDIDAITGATISSKAVAEAINKTVTDFLEKKSK